MRCSQYSRPVLPLLLLISSLAPAPSFAAWAPDSVLTLGDPAGSHPLSWGAILPAGGGDLYAIWHFGPGVSASSGVSRVTGDGGLVFTNYQDYRTLPQGSSLDGSGGVLEAYRAPVSGSNFDIAYRRTSSSGAAQPAGSNYWAAQTPVLDGDPSVATDAAGGAYIGWWFNSSSSNYPLQRVTTAGSTAPGWNSQGRLMSLASSPLLAAPSLLPDGSGGVYMLAAADYIRVWRVRPDATDSPGWPGGGVALSTNPNAYAGTIAPSDLALVPGPAGHTFAAWLENDGTHVNSDSRVAVCRFDDAGSVDGPVLALTSFTSGIGSLKGQSDNQGGLLLSWYRSGAGYFAAHVLANGTVAAGPIQVPGAILAAGRNGGFIAFAAGSPSLDIRAQWFLADGTPDLGEPQNPRLVYVQQTPYPQLVYPLAAYTDGDGGAYLLFNYGGSYIYPPASARAQMMHVFRTGALDVGGPPRPSRLAFSLAPNPAHGELTLDLSLATDGPASIELLDVSGRRLIARSMAGGPRARREHLALPAGIAPGVYLARVTQDGDARVRRFAVIF